MLRLLAPLLITLSLLMAPVSVLAGQAGMHAEMMTCSSEMTHHAAPAGACEMSAEHCAVICAGLQANLPRPEGVSRIVLVSASWPLDRARHGAGLEPALPEQPPRFLVL